MRHAVIDRWSRGSSAMHRFDAKAKIAALTALLIAVATADRAVPWFAGELLAVLLLALVWSRIPLLAALARSAVVLPFAATFAVVSWLAGDPERGGMLALKSYVSALAVLLVVSTTPLPILMGGMEALGAPRFLLEVAHFVYRYLFLLTEEAHSMAQAAAARGTVGRRRSFSGWRERFRVSAGALGVLFARSYVRAENIHRAMLARGFTGRLPGLQMPRFRTADALFLLVAAAVPWILRIVTDRARL